MNPRHEAGITLVEVLVCLLIVAVLMSLALPANSGSGLKRGQMTQTLSNMKQLQLTTEQMALDRATTGDTNVGWPGDIGGTFSNWTTAMATNGYITTNDLCKLLSAPGIVVPLGKIPTQNNTALRVYAVKATSASNTVFLTSANFTNTPAGGQPLQSSAKPYGTKGFIVLRKGGDGSILQARQVGTTNIIGEFAPICP